MFDYTVLIARLQPLHIGHQAVIDRALKRSNQVIILVGSANAARTVKNPFTFEERAKMVRQVFRNEERVGKLIVRPIGDHPSDDRWAADVRAQVRLAVSTSSQVEQTVAITGFEKDASSAYLQWFPEWIKDFSEESITGFNATDVRNAYLERMPRLPGFVCPPEVNSQLESFAKTQLFWDLVLEKEAIDKYHASWASAPFPPVFVTADAVVEQNKKVLLITRDRAPGKGLLALPGGFLDVVKDKTLRDTAVRELREETKIADARGEIPHGRLNDFVRSCHIFDAPERDPRGRVITHAHYFNLPDGVQYTIKGADDAREAAWYPIGPDLDPRLFYADHYHILTHFFGL